MTLMASMDQLDDSMAWTLGRFLAMLMTPTLSYRPIYAIRDIKLAVRRYHCMQKAKSKNHSTQDSRVVPHRGTN